MIARLDTAAPCERDIAGAVRWPMPHTRLHRAVFGRQLMDLADDLAVRFAFGADDRPALPARTIVDGVDTLTIGYKLPPVAPAAAAAPTSPRASLGRIVLYRSRLSDNPQRAAIVSHVVDREANRVDLHVMQPPAFNSPVVIIRDVEEGDAPGCWAWPARS